MGSTRHHRLTAILAVVFVLTACGGGGRPAVEDHRVPPADFDGAVVIDTDRYPTVVDAVASTTDGTTWNFAVTLSSPYDSPVQYADAWRVLDADDNELGIRELGHDHANEQPFTRSAVVAIPPDVDTVFVEGRDLAYGWSGERFAVTIER